MLEVLFIKLLYFYKIYNIFISNIYLNLVLISKGVILEFFTGINNFKEFFIINEVIKFYFTQLIKIKYNKI